MHRRDFLKKKAVLGGSPLAWDQYKRSRNHANNIHEKFLDSDWLQTVQFFLNKVQKKS